MKNIKHRVIFVLSTLVLLVGFYYYIYHGDSYLRDNSKDLSISTICHDNSSCGEGYRLISYPTHSKIFYKYNSFCQIGCGYRNSVVFLDGVDIESFRVLGRNYAVDKNNLYYRYETVDTAGLDLNLNSLSVVDGSDSFAKDNNSVLFAGKKMSGANPDDFRFLNKKALEAQGGDGPVFSKSSDNLFIRGVQANQAMRTGKFYSTFDNKKALPFLCINHVQDSDVYFSCDITSGGKDLLVSVDAETFEVIEHEFSDYVTYAKDKNYVYYLEMGHNNLYVVEGADPKTFHIEGSDLMNVQALDDFNTYLSGCRSNDTYPSRTTHTSDSVTTYCWY